MKALLSMLDYVRWGASHLNRSGVYFGHGRSDALQEAIDVVLHVTKMPHELEDVYWQCHLTEVEKLEIETLFHRRVDERIPLAYLTNVSRFLGLEFYVDSNVIVPRSPIGELIQNEFHPWIQQPPKHILDLCCGSGCLGIVCALTHPDAFVTLVDLSEEALTIAKKNIDDYQLNDRVKCIQSDGLESVNGCFDLIVCNPPYVDASEMERLPAEYRHEPELALASGKDGLDFVRAVMPKLPSIMSDQALFVLEVGASKEAFAQIFEWLNPIEIELENGGEGVFVMNREAFDHVR